MGRRPALVAGLFVVAISALSLIWLESVPGIALALFGVGLGWIFSFVAASAELVDRTRPFERGKLIGSNDLGASLLAAALALLGGFLLSKFGPSALAIMSAIVAIIPALWILSAGRGAAVPRTVGTLNTR